MTKPTVRLTVLRQFAKADPEPFCPMPAFVTYTGRLVAEGMAEPARLRRGFYISEAGRRELARLEAALLAARRRAV